MLVLSRRLQEQIMFPDFKTAVKVLSVRGNTVTLGIDAPQDVEILREDLQFNEEIHEAAVKQAAHFTDQAKMEAERAKVRQLHYLMRNRLNLAGLGLALLARQFDAGMMQDCAITLERINEDFDVLCDQLEGEMREQRDVPVKFTKTLRALLVEDDRNERELLAGFLRLSGLQVDWVGDGTEALEYLRSHENPDVILLDMGLPRCDGPTTVREIRKNPANRLLKIFAVTGHEPDYFRLEGVNRWFRKPLNPEVLLHDLSQELGASVLKKG